MQQPGMGRRCNPRGEGLQVESARSRLDEQHKGSRGRTRERRSRRTGGAEKRGQGSGTGPSCRAQGKEEVKEPKEKREKQEKRRISGRGREKEGKGEKRQGKERSRSPIRADRIGPRSESKIQGEEKGKTPGKEREKEEEERGQQQRLLRGEHNEGGGRDRRGRRIGSGQPFRRRDHGEKDWEASSWSIGSVLVARGPRPSHDESGAGVGHKSGSPPAPSDAILSKSDCRAYEWTHGPGVSDPLLPPGPWPDGASSRTDGCGHTEHQGPSVHQQWDPLHSISTARTTTCRSTSSGKHGGDKAGREKSERGAESVGSRSRRRPKLVKQCWSKRRRQGQDQRQGKERKRERWKGEGRCKRRRQQEGLLERGEEREDRQEEWALEEKGKLERGKDDQKKDYETAEGLVKGIAEPLGGARGSAVQDNSLVEGAEKTEGSLDGGVKGLREMVKHILSCNSVLEFRLADIGEQVCQCMRLCCKPSSMVGDFNHKFDEKSSTRTPPEDPCRKAWIEAIALALSHLAGADFSEEDGILCDTAMKKSIGAQLERFDIWNETCSVNELETFFNSKGVSYTGDEVKLAQRLSWKAVASSLPEGVGELDLSSFCTLGTLEFVTNFENYLVPVESQLHMKAPTVMVEDGGWNDLARGLLQRGVCRVIPLRQVHHIEGKPLLNGMFAVGKQEWVGGLETQRLIMNLTPVNSLVREVQGDLSTLPTLATMGQLFLEEGDWCLTSSEDVRCFFYLFRTPDCWHKYMAFNKILHSSLVPEEMQGEPCVLCATVLPMGFQGSVAIAQHVHRNVVKVAAMQSTPVVGGQGEIRRDLGFPQCKDRFRIYLDNFDQLEVYDRDTALKIQGTTSSQVEALQKAYSEMKIPRHPKKAVARQVRAEVQGALLLGDKGIAIPKPQKFLQYVSMGLQLLRRGDAQLKEMQVVCGGFVYLATFRRPLLCGLNQVWRFMEQLKAYPPVIRLPLPSKVVEEIVRFISLSPLAQISMRCPVAGMVTCSDASLQGGGICRSVGLTPFGQTAAQSIVRGDIPEEHDVVQVLSVGLFDGISGLRTACEVLQLPMAGHVSVEKDDKARRVVESYFPDTIFHDDVTTVDEEFVKTLAVRFSNVGVVLLGGGPPCQGVSGLNFDRRGAVRDHRSSLFAEVPRIEQLFRTHFPWAQVHSLLESVASMDTKDRCIMSEGFGRCPYKIDSLGMTLCRRPRLYWPSWELQGSSEAQVTPVEGDGFAAYGGVSFTTTLDPKPLLEPGWSLAGEALPTFTTARPSVKPGRKPAGLEQCTKAELAVWSHEQHRFPPYQYSHKCGLVNKKGGWRVPSVAEREALMGFPVGYTRLCVPKQLQKGQDYENIRMTLLGNSWQVGVISWLLAQLFYPLGLCEVQHPSQLLPRLTPGGGQRLQSVLLRPPLGRSLGSGSTKDETTLVRKMMGITSMKGDDLLLQGVSEHAVRFHRLRASVPARLWKWRDVAGWQWKTGGEHINILEMRSVLTTIKWWLKKKKVQSLRFLHLVDSLVVLHSLARGRTSSHKLRRTLMRINSLVLGSDLHPIWAYVHTSQNPADRPSRRGGWIKKKWGK